MKFIKNEVIKKMKPYVINMAKNMDEQQEAFLAILEALPKFNPEKSNLSTFLFSVSKNRILDIRKKKREFPFKEERGYYCLDIDKMIDLFKKLEVLGTRELEFFIRVYVLEEKIKDVAEMFDIAPWSLTRIIKGCVKKLGG